MNIFQYFFTYAYDTVSNMKLADDIRQYYLNNFDQLPFDKQFHFASRLAAWADDSDCQAHLASFRDQLVPADHPISEDLIDLMTNLPDNPINAAEERAPYFTKYPELRGLMLALFRVRHLLTIYRVDARQDLVGIKPYAELHELSQDLSKDDNAVRVLSTYAINYMYLVENILFDLHTGVINVDKLYALGDIYNLENKHDVLLLIYLYTHCIIGETNFYQQPVGPARAVTYRKMLDRIDEIIKEHFDDINLDNKLEYLVCCRIMGYETSLSERVYDECSASLSPDGTFLIDTLNTAGQVTKTSFADSEHRNVLFIMSTLPFKNA